MTKKDSSSGAGAGAGAGAGTPPGATPSPDSTPPKGTETGTDTGPGTPSNSGADPGADPSYQVCKVLIDPTQELPKTVALVDGTATRPSETITGEIADTGQVVEAFITKVRVVFREKGQGHLLPELSREFDALKVLRAGMEDNIEQQDQPPNAKLLPDATDAVVVAARQVPGGQNMQIDATYLERKNALLRFLLALRDGETNYSDILDANIAQLQNEINTMVRDGVNAVRSLFRRNLRLRNALGKALEMIDGPAAKGVQRRKENLTLIGKMTQGQGAGHGGHAGGHQTPPTGQGTTPGQTGNPGGTAGTPGAPGSPPILIQPPPQPPRSRTGRGRTKKKTP